MAVGRDISFNPDGSDSSDLIFPRKGSRKKPQSIPATKASWQTSAALGLTRPLAETVICAAHPNPATFRGVWEAVKLKPQTVFRDFVSTVSPPYWVWH